MSVDLRGVSKSYPGRVVGLHSTDLRVEAGERLALLGPSGSGKSTLLRLVAGLEAPDAGEVWIDGQRVDRLPPHQRGVSLLPQRVALYPQMTVAQNLDTSRHSEEAGSDLWSPLIDPLRLTPLLARRPHELSGGERQRVGLAKLLLANRPVWLLDEPFAGLDPMFRDEFRTEFLLFAAKASPTILIVTHDPIDALALGHRIGVLGDGKLQQIGTADELRSRPGNRFVAYCVGAFSLIDGIVERPNSTGDGDPTIFVTEDGSVRVPLPARLCANLATTGPMPRLTLGLRPEDVQPGPPHERGYGLRGWTLLSAEPDGDGRLLTVARGRSRVRVRWSSGSPPPVGTLTDWTVIPDRGVWFDATGNVV
ncbi:MAG: ABC transporter ATP-binding protein [Fimbriiglobus sp.]|nr:ABC transporter ATP-binding protein [Fimbriiglobus sp.]